MRALVPVLVALSLAACGGNDVPSPNERLSGEQGDGGAYDAGSIKLRGDGMSVDAESFFFAAGQTEVEAALARQLGDALESVEVAECGAGRITATSFPSGLTVNFEGGSFVGWFVDEEAPSVTATEDFAIGTARREVEKAPGFDMIEGSTLGEEFTYGKGLAGLFEGDEVAMLYAGKQCFAR